jgi:alpha-glucosidase
MENILGKSMFRIHAKRLAVLVWVCLCVGRIGFGQTATARPAHVDLVAVNQHTFHLSISFADKPHTPASMFVTAEFAKKADVSKTVKAGSWSGIKNEAGQLLMNRTAGSWMLKDSQGRVVIPATAWATLGSDSRTGKAQVICPIGAVKEQVIYGSGDMNGGIVQTRGQSRVGNGITGVPYYWTNAGYSVLALGEDDNAPASWQRDGANGSIVWTVPGSSVDLYVTPAARLEEASADYAILTGKPPVPPRWTMGYMQSRWGWQDRAYIDDTLSHFIDRKLPVDAFIFDFEWYTPQPDYSVPAAGAPNYGDFSWNPALFPEPEKQIAAMHEQGVQVVAIRKPRLGDSDLLEQSRGRGWIRAADVIGRNPFAGRGTEQRLLDYSRPDVRNWYANQLIPLVKAGIDGWWNDEGEQTYTTYTYWNQAETQALARVDPKRRLWTINRAFQPGMQRYGAAAWTGDIASNWRALEDTPTRLLNWSLAGMYYGACDIGGFMGQNTPELLTRWMEAGVFFPVMRSHSSNRVQPRFPWLYGGQAESAIRKALELRYRLVPYYYSLAHEAWEKGMPLMRPLAMEFPDDPQVANMTSQWLMGNGLMPAPILTADNQRSVYFPKGTWYGLGSNKTRAGGQSVDVSAALDEIPVFVRAGTILPLGPVVQHTRDLPGGPLDAQVYPGANSTFTLVEDDGNTTEYKTGEVRRVTFTWNDSARSLTWKVEGPYRGKDIFKEMKVTVFDPNGLVTRNGSLKSSGKMSFAK